MKMASSVGKSDVMMIYDDAVGQEVVSIGTQIIQTEEMEAECSSLPRRKTLAALVGGVATVIVIAIAALSLVATTSKEVTKLSAIASSNDHNHIIDENNNGSLGVEVLGEPDDGTSTSKTKDIYMNTIIGEDNNDLDLGNLTITTFSGNASDFINSADLDLTASTRRSPSQSNVNGIKKCPLGEGLAILLILTDDYPWETSWKLYRQNDKNSSGSDEVIIASGPPTGRNYNRRTKYIGRICLPSGQYYMRWFDTMGDSICCEYGPGEWSVSIDDVVVLQNDPAKDKGSTQTDYPFDVGGSVIEDEITGTFLIMPRPFNPDIPAGVELLDGTIYELRNISAANFEYAKSGLVSGESSLLIPVGTEFFSSGIADMKGQAPRSGLGNRLLFGDHEATDWRETKNENDVDKGTQRNGRVLRVPHHSHRHLSNIFEGFKTILVVRVIAADQSTSLDETSLSNSIFGNGVDKANLVSQYKACSYGKLQFGKAPNRSGRSNNSGNVNISNGVVTVRVPSISTAHGDGTESDGLMRNAITKELNEIFSAANPKELADYAIYCLPPGTYKNIAYAYINHWLSPFNDDWCTSMSLQMHELGHLMNMGHSNEGGTEYEDLTGIMGSSFRNNDGPLMCFNAVKSWQTGWYKSKSLTINSNSGASNCFDGILHGIADFLNTLSTTVLIKIQNRSDRDYYVNFNAKRGINSGTQEAFNQVTVASRPRGARNSYAESELEAKLSSGQSYLFRGYSVSVGNIDVRVGTAQIKVLPSGQDFCDKL